jgi:PhnB protein
MPKSSAKKTTAKKSASKKPVAKKATSAKASKASKKFSPKKPKKVVAVPAKYGAVTPHLIVSPCNEALSFYEKAFGAKIVGKMAGPDGLVPHAEFTIGGALVMCSDEMPAMPGMPRNRKTPKNAGAITGGVMLYVKDVDAFVKRALDAGAIEAMPVQDMFWGDHYGQVQDPFGHVWSVATHVRDVSSKEMQKAMAAMAAMAADSAPADEDA